MERETAEARNIMNIKERKRGEHLRLDIHQTDATDSIVSLSTLCGAALKSNNMKIEPVVQLI